MSPDVKLTHTCGQYKSRATQFIRPHFTGSIMAPPKCMFCHTARLPGNRQRYTVNAKVSESHTIGTILSHLEKDFREDGYICAKCYTKLRGIASRQERDVSINHHGLYANYIINIVYVVSMWVDLSIIWYSAAPGKPSGLFTFGQFSPLAQLEICSAVFLKTVSLRKP